MSLYDLWIWWIHAPIWISIPLFTLVVVVGVVVLGIWILWTQD